MACCKCIEHRWDDPQDVVYRDQEGNEYCVFHAPAEHKGMPVDDFHALISERIQATIDLEDAKAVCNLRGTVFPKSVCFASEADLPKLILDSGCFAGDVILISNRISGMLSLMSVHIEGVLKMSKVHICGVLRAIGAVLNSRVFFADVHVDGDVDFWNIESNGLFSLEKMTCDGVLFFGGGRCLKGFFANDITVYGETAFRTFVSRESFLMRNATLHGGLFFVQSQLAETSVFRNLTLEKGAVFEKIISTNDLKITIANCTFPEAGLTFKDCDPTSLDLTEQRDLSNIHFINTPWEKNGRIKACTEDEAGKLQPTRDFYQRMKAKYKAENNEYEASKWHIAEKEAQLKLLTQNNGDWFNWVMLNLYKFSSGFGENAWQALKVLLLVLFLPLVWTSVDIQINFFGWSLQATQAANVIDEWLKYVPLTRAMDGDFGAVRAVMFFWQLLVSVQAALFAFALRNNFRR